MSSRVRTALRLGFIIATFTALMAFASPAFAAGSIVTGTLTDGDTGLAVPDATVELWSYTHTAGWALADVCISGPAGEYQFLNVAPAIYDVECVAVGYWWGYSDMAFNVGADQSLTEDLALWSLVPSTPYLSGTVRDASTELGVIGAEVDVYYKLSNGVWDIYDRMRTDADGAYSIYDLPAGTFRVGFKSETYESQYWNAQSGIESGADVVCDGINEVRGIDATLTQLPQAVAVTGAVFDSASSAPVSGAKLIAFDPASGIHFTVAQTDASGSYSMAVPEGVLQVDVVAPGYDEFAIVTPPLASGLFPCAVWLSSAAGPDLAIGGVAQNGLYAAMVTPTASSSDPNAAITATLNGETYAPGTPVSAEGTYDLVITATDGLGKATSAAVDFVIDSTPPVLTIEGVSDGGLYNAAVTPGAWSPDRSATVTATLNDQPFTLGTPVSAEGTYVLSVTAKDLAGNSAASVTRFTLDTSAPAITISGVDAGQSYDHPVTPVATCDDASAVLSATIDGLPFALGMSVSSVGSHTLAVTAVDLARNTASKTIGFAIVSTATPVPPATPAVPATPAADVARIAGADRYAVAAALARRGWDPEGTGTWGGVRHVIIVNGEPGKEVDSLSAAGLAGAYGAPVLFVQATRVPASTKTALREIAEKNPGVRLHLVGGTGSIPDARWSDLKAIPGVSGTKDRLTGADRYAVSVRTTKRIVSVRGIANVTGVIIFAADDARSFYDALAVSPAAYAKSMPMLGVRKTSVPAATAAVLSSTLAEKPRYAANSSAYLSAGVMSAVGSKERLATSPKRFTAAAQIATAGLAHGWLAVADTGIAAKQSDALTGGVFLGKSGGVLLFTDSSDVIPSATAEFVTAHHDGIRRGWVLGGAGSIASTQKAQFLSMLK